MSLISIFPKPVVHYKNILGYKKIEQNNAQQRRAILPVGIPINVIAPRL
jgi:hypothetical protein